MEKAYNYIYLFFVAIFFVLIWGFWRTYLVFFPSFKGFGYTHHIHGLLMMTWIVMLIAQPLLIKAKKLALHRVIGKLSYLVVPLLLLSIFMVGRISYYKLLSQASYEVAIGDVALNMPSIVAFTILYGLAILNRKKARMHMRYMIGTSLLMIGPGLGRALIIYFAVPFPVAVSYTSYVTIMIAAGLLLSDIIRKKPYLPYTVTLVLMVLLELAWHFRLSPVWQAIGGKYAAIFY